MIFNKTNFNACGERSDWDLGNQVLYDLCKNHPFHNKPDEIIAKMWLIGRSYAASIERRKNKKNETNDEFYSKVVNEVINFNRQEKLDERIKKLDNLEINKSMVKQLLVLHKDLLKLLEKLTKLDKRSFVSKYLHFHCENIPIYDSRAKIGMMALSKGFKKETKLIKKDLINELNKEEYDEEYLDFCSRYLACYNSIKSKIGNKKISARWMDNYLLYLAEK